MKKIPAFLVVAVFLIFCGRSAWAHEDAKTTDQSLTGEVVCLSCYLGHGAMGEDHAACAKQCFKKGMPVGLKVGDKLYLVVGEHHDTANDILVPYAGKQVMVTGHVFEQDGMSMVKVEKIGKAGSPQAAVSSDAAAGNAGQAVWVCPMGDYSGPKTADGKCPKCGMDLVQKK